MAATLIHTNAELRGALAGAKVAFVPTMGALHMGHLALIRRAVECGRPVVVSIFVNPTQFAPGEDFNRYPRTLDRDIPAAEGAGADVIYAPSVEEMYPPGAPPPPPLPLPDVAVKPGLEEVHRPGHFAGVCQVVARLFDLVTPRWAIFGEKDYQQLLVIRAMVEHVAAAEPDRWPSLQVISHPTIREPDGLAMSSRNEYLSPEDRQRALGLSRALATASNEPSPRAAESAMQHVLEAHELSIDYAAVRDVHALMPIKSFDRPARALIAVRVGSVRLIDNAAIPPDAASQHVTDEGARAR